MSRVILQDGVARVEVRPDLGAGIAAYAWNDTPMLRPSHADTVNPFDLALILLVPWSGRISGGGFMLQDRFHGLTPNVGGEALPLHGNAFQCPWAVDSHTGGSVALSLRSAGPGPFRYESRVVYALDAGVLSITLSVVNAAATALPFGLGLHPWFPRSPGTVLRAAAAAAWREDARHLPAASAPVAHTPEWDFTSGARLPAAWINAWFTGWDGLAAITWPERGVALDIAASPMLSTYVVYSPSAEAGFFCFEPVSHPVDAHNLPGRPGLAMLASGESVSASATFRPRAIQAGPCC